MQNRALPSQLGVRPAPELANRFLVQSFGWMVAGLLLTTAISTVVATNPTLIEAVAKSWLIFIFLQLGLGIGIQALMPRLSATLGLGLFFVFAATMGVTVGVIVSLYKTESAITSFFGASAMFGAAAIYSATTKSNLHSIGGLLVMRMVGPLAADTVI